MRITNSRWLRSVTIAGAAPLTLLLAPAAAQAPGLAMLDRLQPGEWEVRFRDGSTAHRLCVRSGRELIQLRHTDRGCSRYVVDDGASEVTVQYTCKGTGYGRTSIRRESSVLAQLESQGIAGGLPFQFTAEARRVGACSS